VVVVCVWGVGGGGGGGTAAKLQPSSAVLSVKVIFSQRGINFLSQAAHSAHVSSARGYRDDPSVKKPKELYLV